MSRQSRPFGADEGEDWTTPRVVDFLGVSRQAVNKRLHGRTILGYRDGRRTRFPAWQFDREAAEVRPEVAELLEALGDGFEPAEVSRWTVTVIPELNATPAQLLLSAATKGEALRLAAQRRRAGKPTADDEGAADDRHEASSHGRFFERVRAELESQEQNSRLAILLAAAELFARHGPAKVSLREVAAAAGVPYSLIYRFFGTKDKLLAAAMELLVTYGGQSLYEETDAYSAIANTLGADSGQWSKMVTWAILDEVPPSRLFRPGLRSGGYRQQIEKLWEDPEPPRVRENFDPRVVASLIQLVIGNWETFEPYLSILLGDDAPDSAAQHEEVVELLQLLVWAARPGRAGA
ncbi:helix-turn-helix transcriptional regulator [Nocardia flavorosea]|uniref:helix-turn-helix domain-containing protein n=1 Tax=Nocardia flavorosea TaxID=53429 RepID=UPI001894E9C0|nr:helix-turn-helix domain-containing protein [Nocardia flavorosea]MBF6347948.1 helix-turn-helix transcriptional regulator [Nocardia flavorosea]